MSKKQPIPLAPNTFELRPKHAKSKLTREAVTELQVSYVEKGYDVKLVYCGRRVKLNGPLEGAPGSFFVYYDQFRMGLNFPLCEEFAQVLDHYGVVLAQIVPTSIARVMTFILYLKRFERTWSIELFHRHFYCHIRAEGYAQFLTTPALKINGLDSKLQDWKSYFCRVDSSVDVDVPRRPASVAVVPLSKEEKAAMSEQVLVLDARQYARNNAVLKRLVYTSVYAPMYDEDWRASDKALEEMINRRAPVPLFPYAGMSLSEQDFREGLLKIEAAPVGEDHGEPIDSSREMAYPLADFGEGGPSLKRQRTDRRNQSRGEASSSSAPKVVISPDQKVATVDLTQDWFPASASTAGVAHSLGQTLVSPYLEERFQKMPLDLLRDQAARFHAASWKICDHLGEELHLERRTNAQLEEQAIKLDRENLALISKCEGLTEKSKADEAKYSQSLIKNAEIQERLVRRSVEKAVGKLEEKYRREVEELQASVRGLEEQNQARDDDAVRHIRHGIALSLRCLRKNKAIAPEWDDAEKVERWLADCDDVNEGSAKDV